MKISRSFYTRRTLRVARDLLGKFIVRKINRRKIVGMIVETEAYVGPEDKASHAYGGKRTKRNRAEYLIGGHIYIYLVYGMYWQLNISTGEEGMPECVLLRALQPFVVKTYSASHASKIIPNGPGKLCQYLKVDKSFYAEDLTKSKRIWLIDNKKFENPEIVVRTRIGIDYAGEWAKKPWRFYIKGNQFVSKK